MKTTFLAVLFLLSTLTFAQGPDQQTPEQHLYNAACAGNMTGIQFWMGRGAPVDSRGPEGYTALSCAAKYDRILTVRFLLDHGADINASDNNRDKTPLMQACFQGHWDVAEVLMVRHADLNHQAVNKWTALHDAAYIGDIAIVRSLVNSGASRVLLNERNETPLGTAIRAYTDCENQSPDCPITRGDSHAPLADFKHVVTYLTNAQKW